MNGFLGAFAGVSGVAYDGMQPFFARLISPSLCANNFGKLLSKIRKRRYPNNVEVRGERSAAPLSHSSRNIFRRSGHWIQIAWIVRVCLQQFLLDRMKLLRGFGVLESEMFHAGIVNAHMGDSMAINRIPRIIESSLEAVWLILFIHVPR
jgi:hypothetical protein